MFHGGQSVAVDSTDAFDEDSGRRSDDLTQVPLRDASAVVNAWLVRES